MADAQTDLGQTLTGVGLLMNSTSRAVRFIAGTRIFSEGSPGEVAYMIDSGYVEISTYKGGHKHIITVLGPGEIFGEMAVLDGQPRSATAIALHESVLIPISSEQLWGEVDSGSPIIRVVLTAAISRLRALQADDTHSSAVDSVSCKPEIEKNTAARARASQQLKLRFDMQAAIASKQFELAYQPIVSLANGRTAGFEALVRWPRSNGSIESPDNFIPLAEQSRLIIPLGAWVLETALQALESMSQTFKQGQSLNNQVFMSINVSPVQLEREEDVEQLARIIEQSNVNPACVKIEITEQALLLDPRMATIGLARLKATGASIAIDDFGTGYSSLNYLHRFPLDTLKIDRSFVSRIVDDQSRQVVVGAIINLAHTLGMDVVAEGVEEADEACWLRSQACRYIQGYLISKPAPFATAFGYLKREFDF